MLKWIKDAVPRWLSNQGAAMRRLRSMPNTKAFPSPVKARDDMRGLREAGYDEGGIEMDVHAGTLRISARMACKSTGAERGTVLVVAKQLGVTQPGLSHVVARTERRFGALSSSASAGGPPTALGATAAECR